MPPPVIAALPTPPTRTDPANFSARADAFLAALPNFGSQQNALAAYMNTASADTITAAENARDAAVAARTGAETARTQAQTARTGAETARTQAQTAQGAAETARTGAQTARTGAEAARDAAQGHATSAGNYAAAAALHVGTIMWFATNAPPAGWLVCDGNPVTTLYPDLRALLIGAGSPFGSASGDPRTPDLRGEFVRGWDGGRGADAGRVFGSAQGDAIRNIVGKFDPGGNIGGKGADNYTGPFQRESTPSLMSNEGGRSDARFVTFDASRTVPTADENRPRNIALLPCIKAFGTVSVEGMATLTQLRGTFVSRDQDTSLAAGYTSIARALGVVSSGFRQLTPTGGNMMTLTNNGSFELRAPTASGDYTLLLAITNGTSAGAITLTGFTKITGDSLTTTNGEKTFFFVTKIGPDVLGNFVRVV